MSDIAAGDYVAVSVADTGEGMRPRCWHALASPSLADPRRARNGSQARASTAGGMPSPYRRRRPQRSRPRRCRHHLGVCAIDRFEAGRYQQPAAVRHRVPRMTTRLRSAVSNCGPSILAASGPAESLISNAIGSGQAGAAPPQTADQAVMLWMPGSNGWRREKARSCWVSLAPRSAARCALWMIRRFCAASRGGRPTGRARW